MSFFSTNRIPEQFFSILNSKYKDLYVDTLFVILKSFRTEFTIRKQDLATGLCNTIEPYLTLITGDDEEISGKSLSEKSHAIIRRLASDGWLRVEPNSITFEETFTVPDYVVKVIKVLYDIANEKPKEYNSFVHSTYVGLNAANENRDEYVVEALLAAYRNTEELIDSLHSLHNNIREFYQRIQEQTDISQLMKEHFENYHQHVIEKFYHRMKTTDCIPRFRTNILTILNKWTIDFHLLEQISNQMVHRGITQNVDEAHNRVLVMLNYMIDAYDNIHLLLREIDRKNSNYIKASVERTQYLLITEKKCKRSNH